MKYTSLSFFDEMVSYGQAPDAVWLGPQGLEVCTLANSGYDHCVTRYEADSSTLGYVREGYSEGLTGCIENDAVIAQFYQEELSRLAETEASGFTNPDQASIVQQEWSCPPVEYYGPGQENQGKGFTNPGGNEKERDVHDKNDDDYDDSSTETRESENSIVLDNFLSEADVQQSIEIEEDSSVLDGEVGKRLNQMIRVPHVPKINGELPSEDEEVSDHERLLQRLQLYGLVENEIEGDGNCQFRSLSDQLYRSSDQHKFVREQVVYQLKSNPEMYEGYVPMTYDNYLKKMCKSGEWGDHVTLQAAADWFGVRILVITSFKDTCYIEILPHSQKSNRLICLSFWAEVHYNSIYPEGELQESQGKKKKRWWELSL